MIEPSSATADRAGASNVRYRLGSIFIILLALLIRANRVGELGTQNDEGLHITIAERLVEGDVS